MSSGCHSRHLNHSSNNYNQHHDLPVWQNDSEVSQCNLCNSHFSLINRRHHCRKCGKIICGNCSNNYISYLLNTPIINQFNFYQPNKSKIQTYKTCDECTIEINMIKQVINNETTTTTTSQITIQPQSQQKSSNVIVFTHNLNNSSNTSITNTSDINLCPVCSNDLLKLYIKEHKKNKDVVSNEEFENFKEIHINQCLTQYDFNTLHSNRFSPDSNPKNKMLVYNIPPIPKPTYENIDEINAKNNDTKEAKTKIIPNNEGKELEEEEEEEEEEEDDDDESNECVICLEDLKPGDKVGRLECLCVFHYKCIKDWFNKKGYGECPVHFLHK
ncbi:unnamed protein product [Candida verbasci]|uniref:Uncharacterized protein n=1 Tax=Candida verbasci TaxID=1227364 RepID=A0A9W4TSK1_9ASCO|nr:unnamed protein product [Candida verbasci]